MLDLATIGIAMDTSGLDNGTRSLNRTADAADRTADAADRTGNSLRGMSSYADLASKALASIGPLAGLFTASAALGKLVSVQREFDVLNSSLKTVTGSSADAAREMEWIKQFAKETPFGLAQATQGFVKMKSLGLDPSRAALTSFGNTAAAMGKDLNQMIEAVADASTGEFERLKEFGIKAKKEGDNVSLTFQGVTKTIGNNAAEITSYLEAIGNTSFGGAMAERANTLDGAIASLGDTWDELFRTISAQNAGTLMHDAVRMAEGAVTDLTTIIAALNGTTADNAQQTGAMATVQEGLAIAFETVAVLGTNVKYTLVQVGNELVGLAAQAVAVATGQFAQAAEIGRLMRADAERARKEVDATSERIVNARAVAAQMATLSAPNNYDEPAILRARAAGEKAIADAKIATAKAARDAEAAEAARRKAAESAGKQAQKAAEAELEWRRKTTLDLIKLWDDQAEAAQKSYDAARMGALKLADATEAAQAATTASLAEKLAAMRDEIDAIGLTGTALAELNATKAEQVIADKEIQLIMLRNADASVVQIQLLEQEINLRKQIVAAMRGKAGKEAAVEAGNETKKAWQKASDDIEKSLTDALMRGFESGKGFAQNLRDTIVNMFKTLVLRPIISAVVNPVAQGITGALGLAGAANAGQSAIGTASTAFSLSNLTTSITTLGTQVSALGSAFTTGLSGFTTGSSLANTAALGSAYGTGGGAAASAGYLAAPVAIAAVVANALGLFRKTTTVGSGLMGELGGEINSYDLRRKSGTLFSGPDYSIRDNGLASQNQALQDAFRAMRTGAIQVADAFGLSAEGVEKFTTRIGNELINPDTGGYGLKLEGLNEAEIQAKVQAALATANDAIAAEILGIKTVTVDTIKRTVTEVGSTWDDGYTTITREVEEQVTSTGLAVRRDLLPWMQRIADASGPTAATLQAIAAYPDQLLQLAGTSRDALVQAFGQGLMTGDAQAAGQTVANQLVASIELSMMGNASAQIFDIINRGIVTPMIDALLTGQSVSAALSQSSLDAVVAKATATAKALGAVLNDPAFAAAMDAIRANVGSALGSAGAALNFAPRYQIPAPTIATATASASSLGDTVVDLAKKFANAKTSLSDTGHGLAIDLVRATGDEMAAQRMEREQYLAGFADLTAAEQAHLAVMYDQNQAIRDQITAIEKANAVAEQKAGLERQWLELNGDTAAIRALELATIDPANRALQESIWARQDEKTAAEEATRAADQLASAYASLASAADSTASRYLSGQALTDYQYNRFAEQANGIAGGGMVTGDVLQALGIADIQAAVLEFVRGDAAPEARAAVLQLGASLIDLKQSAIDAATAAEKAAAATAAEALAKAQATLQQLDDKAASESQRLSIALGQMLGQTAELRALELSQLEPANRALQQYIWTLEDQAAATESATATARSGTDNAYSALDRAVSAQRKIIDTQRAAAQSLVQDVSGIFSNLRSNVRDLFGEVESTRQYQAAQGRAFIGTALAGARAGAGLPDADDLAQAISAARGGLDAQVYASQAEADFQRLVLANELKALQDISGLQLSEAERQLQLAESQLSALDGTLEAAKAQIDALRGIDTSVISVEQAIANLSAAIRGEASATAGGAAPSAVEQAAQAYGASVSTYSAQAQSAIDIFLAEIAKLPGQVDPGFVQSQLDYFGRVYADVPAFAGGGYHTGGIALVGEEGPELVDLGPSRIYTAPQTSALLGLGHGNGQNDARIASEIKLLREENAAQARALVLAVKQLEKLQRRWEVEGMPATRNETGAPVADVLVL